MLLLHGSVACVCEIVGAFFGRDEVEQVSELSPCCLDGSRLCISHPVLELGEELLDGIEIGTVGRQEEHVGAGLADGAAGGLALVAAEIVEDDDVTLGQRWGENLLGIKRKELAVDRAIDDERRIDAVVSERADEGQGLPMMGWTPPDGINVPRWCFRATTGERP